MCTTVQKVSGIILVMLALLQTPSINGGNRLDEKEGALVVFVTWGDDDNTPAKGVYVEAHGYVKKYNSEKSFVLKGSTPGRYETSLPPGLYDVFVSDGISEPRCRRMRIREGLTGKWTLRLEMDEVYIKD